MFTEIGGRLALTFTLFFAAAGISFAQGKPAATSPEKSAAAQEKGAGADTALPPGILADGAKAYRDYCTGCHGPSGTGDGPAAAVLNTKPPDLTTLSQRHDGKFPAEYVAKVLRHGVNQPAHGTSDMPIWGPIFAGNGTKQEVAENQHIANMITYLASIQKQLKKK